ncbi:MAG TPA: ferritin-like domain-containing protein [Halanaerobiales bacterium]|nr:ferritin-like domain-containing protein [Halanaerobiales bacterium]
MAEFHEDNLSEEAKDYHRIIKSLMEELEAVDWYNQRADVTTDQSVQGIVEHNRDEEIEHAAMAIEWLRRNDPVWAEELETYLFTQSEITAVEEEAEGGGAEGEEDTNNTSTSTNQSLGISSLKGGNN